jgi:hypothetical protein
MSFGECLFLQGVIRKDPKEVHISDLHRDKKATYTKKNLEDMRMHWTEGGVHLSPGQGYRPGP